MKVVVVVLVAVLSIALAISLRRRRRQLNIDAINEATAYFEAQNEDETNQAKRDAQAEWARGQELITADSILTAVQGVRATITHAGAAEARAVLDSLQKEAADHPEGVPGHVVASARLRFDELMRANVQ